MDARRASKRYECQTRLNGAGATTVRGDVHDVSTYGLNVTTPLELVPGQMLHLDFTLPTGEVQVVGEVRWAMRRPSGSFDVGVRFIRIPQASAVAIRALTDAPPPPPFTSDVMRRYTFR